MDKKKFDNLIIISFLLLAVFDVFLWQRIIFGKPVGQPHFYFLDVGQGDAELAILPANVKILVDAGPDKKILSELEKIPALTDRYIDIAVISHSQLDHFNGFKYLLENYRVGAFIFNGRSDSAALDDWKTLLQKIKEKNVPLLTLAGGDSISYINSRLDFLLPDSNLLQSAELNDTGLIGLLNAGGAKVLLTADIDSDIERTLINDFNVKADILKVPHHGSKYSSSEEFLKAVRPAVAVIEVGSRNPYGHPTKEALARLASVSANIFRTDLSGTIEAAVDNNKLKIFTEK